MIAWYMANSGRQLQRTPQRSVCKRCHGENISRSFYLQDGGKNLLLLSSLRRVTVTQFPSESMPAGFRRHLVGKTLRSACFSAVT